LFCTLWLSIRDPLLGRERRGASGGTGREARGLVCYLICSLAANEKWKDPSHSREKRTLFVLFVISSSCQPWRGPGITFSCKFSAHAVLLHVSRDTGGCQSCLRRRTQSHTSVEFFDVALLQALARLSEIGLNFPSVPERGLLSRTLVRKETQTDRPPPDGGQGQTGKVRPVTVAVLCRGMLPALSSMAGERLRNLLG
jgi:hypothetical protein